MSNFDNPFASDPKPEFGSAPMGPTMGPPPQSGLALTSMILGIVGIALSLVACCCQPLGAGSIVLGIAALILGYMGQQDIAKTGKSGKEMALAGMICGGVATALGLLMIVVFIISLVMHVGAAAANNNQFRP